MNLEDRDKKAIETYVTANISNFLKMRKSVQESGGNANVLYIHDLLPRKKDELRVSPMLVDTGMKVFGMKIIMDFRIPNGEAYITYGELR